MVVAPFLTPAEDLAPLSRAVVVAPLISPAEDLAPLSRAVVVAPLPARPAEKPSLHALSPPGRRGDGLTRCDVRVTDDAAATALPLPGRSEVGSADQEAKEDTEDWSES